METEQRQPISDPTEPKGLTGRRSGDTKWRPLHHEVRGQRLRARWGSGQELEKEGDKRDRRRRGWRWEEEGVMSGQRRSCVYGKKACS